MLKLAKVWERTSAKTGHTYSEAISAASSC
jgi:hypothetical protein